ncbi:hypothetical protein [Ferruginibacter sp. HRS2-29]|uniref:hypothetical protein n=1 Tax=Ferruginibacter sp. HRS2-29 TaxID=2487334 RepID=UPI0020CDDC9A|nr:hypothetical protein [Ferruginibacter sp. HRS2-29]
MRNELHFENGDLTGEISVTFKEGETLNELFSRYIHDFNADRLEAYAVRLLIGKETILTLYAADLRRQENTTVITEKIPVKKFKIPDVSLSELVSLFGEINLTLTNNNFPINEMQVINK